MFDTADTLPSLSSIIQGLVGSFWYERLFPSALSASSIVTTLTVAVAVKPPSSVVAVMVAVPAPTPVTTPLSTVATFSSLLVQIIFLLLAFAGSTTAVISTGAAPT